MEGITKNSSNVLKRISTSDDPLRELGPGISTYHQLLVMLFALFAVLAFLHIPVIKSFRDGDFYEHGIFAYSSVGNLGFSEA